MSVIDEKNSAQHLHPAEVAARQRGIIIRVVRIVFAILVVTFTTLAIVNAIQRGAQVSMTLWWIPLVASVVIVALVSGIDRLTPVKKISTVSAVAIGLLIGLLATLAMSGLVDLTLQSWLDQGAQQKELAPIIDSIKIVFGISLSYLAVVTILQTQDDFRLVIPYVEFAKQLRGVRPMLVDTSALIDGRIADVASTGFVQSPLIIPRFVVAELQTLADSGDATKRNRGRRGLDLITKLQRIAMVDVTIDDKAVPGKGVDTQLVELAREMNAMILTGDVALARIASIHSVPVLNLNDLAIATRMSLVPGEPVTVKLIKHGEQAGQGVGYLGDGTMVVAENGGHRVGDVVTMVVSSSLQTSAGRLVFARIGEEEAGAREIVGESAAGELMAGSEQASERTSERGEDGSGDKSVSEGGGVSGGAGSGGGGGRGPFPPKGPRTMKAGTPRNPRR
ncbi:hypothetical protein LBMAG48_00020 [Phycisphaerae bacterium]|nr:hypothetical protein LBMAG48_00020 [Phycisphaerae bacterium]